METESEPDFRANLLASLPSTGLILAGTRSKLISPCKKESQAVKEQTMTNRTPATNPMSSEQILSREFLELRCKVLELAAALDRIDRAAGSRPDDPRRQKLEAGLRILLNSSGDRAEEVQLLFSRVYESDWREKFALPAN